LLLYGEMFQFKAV